MAAIAARVGGSKATLYGYFKSKEELFGAVVQAVSVESLVPVLDGLEPGSPDFDTTIHRVALAMVHYFVNPDAVASYRLAVAESARFPELGRAFYENGRARGQRKIALWFQRQMVEGRLEMGDAEIAAEQFVALCEIGPGRQMLLGADLKPGEGEVCRLATQAVATFLAAYGVGDRMTTDRST